MNHMAISGLLIFITSIFSVIFVVIKGPQKDTRFTWSLFSLAVAFWGFGLLNSFVTDVESIVLFWARFLNLSAIFIPIFFFHFILCFTNKIKSKRGELYFYYTIFLSLFLAAVVFPRTFVSQVKPILSFKYYPEPGLLYYVFVLLFVYLVIYGLTLLFKDLKSSVGIRRNQVKYLLFGVFVGFTGGATTFFPVFNIKIYPLGTYLVPIYVLTVTYAIIKYHLLDINIALTRAGIFAIVYFFVLGTPFWLGFRFLGKGPWILPVSIMAVFATLGPFIYQYLRKRAEDILLADQRRYQGILRRLSATMTLIKDLDHLLKLIVFRVTKAVKVEFACAYLLEEGKQEFQLKFPYSPQGRFPGLPFKIPVETELISSLKQRRKPFFAEEFSSRIKQAFPLSSGLMIPSFIRQRLLGFLILGPKSSGVTYTPDDVLVFETLANQTALAIENIQFFERIQHQQAELFTAQRLSDLGKMASGMGHQIKNRLNVISILSGVAKETPDPEQLKENLTKIEANTQQAGEIITRLSNFARPQSQDFQEVSLKEVVNEALSLVGYKQKLESTKIDLDFSTDYLLKANQQLLVEVFFNLLDNALDAIQMRKASLKEEAYQPRIQMQAQVKENFLEVQIKDNGLGMRREELQNIFIPFFTTKATSQKGTGLGLYVIKKIIEDVHKGRIEVSSVYAEGTSFCLNLPQKGGR